MTIVDPDTANPGELRRARLVTYGVTGLIVFCCLLGLEWWPLSGFRLFSSIRTENQISWEMTTVSSSGDETSVNLADLPVSHWGAHHVIPELPTMSMQEQQAAVLAWLGGANVTTGDVVSVRFYEVESQVPTDPTQAPSVASRSQLLEVPLP